MQRLSAVLIKQDFQMLQIFRPKTLQNCWSTILGKSDFLGKKKQKSYNWTLLLLLITQSYLNVSARLLTDRGVLQQKMFKKTNENIKLSTGLTNDVSKNSLFKKPRRSHHPFWLFTNVFVKTRQQKEAVWKLKSDSNRKTNWCHVLFLI